VALPLKAHLPHGLASQGTPTSWPCLSRHTYLMALPLKAHLPHGLASQGTPTSWPNLSRHTYLMAEPPKGRLSRAAASFVTLCALGGWRGRRTSWPRRSSPAASSVTCGATPPTAMVWRDSHVNSAILRGIPPSTARLDTRNKFRAFPIHTSPYVSICQHMSAHAARHAQQVARVAYMHAIVE
jgi:hypothetical protein